MNIKYYLAPKHLDLAIYICITSNGLVESCGNNVLIRITINLKQTSQRYLRETKCKLVINLVTKEWRKVIDTPLLNGHFLKTISSSLTQFQFPSRNTSKLTSSTLRSIVNKNPIGNIDKQKMHKRLLVVRFEPYEGKLSRTVPRRERVGNDLALST
jgi:hypothetical protein